MKYLLGVIVVLLVSIQVIFGMPTPTEENDYQDYEQMISNTRCSNGTEMSSRGRCETLVRMVNEPEQIDLTIFDMK